MKWIIVNDGYMNADKKIPEFENYEDIAEFWDNHSLADYWDQTEPAEFQVSPETGRHYLVALDKELLLRLQKIARIRGLSIETTVNLLLEQRMNELETPVKTA